MKSILDLKKFVRNNLIDDLNKLENERKGVLTKIITYWITLLILATIVLFMFSAYIFDLIQFFLGGLILVLSFIYYYFSKNYVSNYKELIIKEIIKFIDPSLKYEPTNYITKYEFEQSEIFQQHSTIYKGDDLVSGKIGDTKIKFSELLAKRTTGSGKNRRTIIIFKGLYFIANFPKKFKTTTFVLPDTAEKLFGFLGTKFQSWNKSRGQLVKLEDPEFEKLFVVYGEDQIEARYILSTSLMSRIKKFRKKSNKKISMSFKDNHIFVAIHFNKNLFEPRVFKSLYEFESIQEYYEDLTLVIEIVKDFNLNLRIWKS